MKLPPSPRLSSALTLALSAGFLVSVGAKVILYQRAESRSSGQAASEASEAHDRSLSGDSKLSATASISASETGSGQHDELPAVGSSPTNIPPFPPSSDASTATSETLLPRSNPTALGLNGLIPTRETASGTAPQRNVGTPVSSSSATTLPNTVGIPATFNTSPAANRGTSPASGANPAPLPAALAPQSPGITLDAQQSAAWDQIENDFVNAVGGLNQDPNDPAYRARWMRAKVAADQMFKTKFGETAFLLQSFEASRQSSN